MAEIERCILSVTFLRTLPDLFESSVSTAMNAGVMVSKTASHSEHRNDMISINRIDTVIVNIEAKIYQMGYFNARDISKATRVE